MSSETDTGPVDDDVTGLIPEVGPVQEVDLPHVEEVRIDPPAWPSPPSIVVEGVAKWYDGSNRGHLRFALPRALPAEPPAGAVMALAHADLAIGDGQSVGIIGNNGAGKSTILKLIAGVTPPSRGEVRVKGRVASMIELGLGFHPDMTGTENLFFAAALLGMSKRTLRSRWDDIVEFSGVAHALDQPVKHYSSGMLARLGFALASHSDADVILVDEVLSVGDFDFQRRSLERIMKLNREGRTTVIVTHNLDALPPLCHRIVQLEKGRVVADGTPSQVLADYVATEAAKYAAHGHDSAHISDLHVSPKAVHPAGSFTVRGTVETAEALPGSKVVLRVGLGAAVVASLGAGEMETYERLSEEPLDINLAQGPGRWKVEVTVKSIPFFPGDYHAGLAILQPGGKSDVISASVPIDVLGVRDEFTSLRLAVEEDHERID